MSFKVHDVDQRTPEWTALRLGRVCSTSADDLLATLKSGGEAAGRRNLRARLVLERLTGRSHERSFQSQAMIDGIDREAAALEKYEEVTGLILRRVGFVSHTSLMAGWSPDGVIGDFVGAVEAKCPIPATHLEYIETGKVPLDYYRQCLHAFWLVPSLQFIDWFSFQPDFPESLQLRCVRLTRNEDEIAAYDKAARTFLDEVERRLEALLTMADLRGQLAAAV